MADIKWIKIVTDLFENRKIRQIESLPEGYGLLVIWIKILCLAGTCNDGGRLSLAPDLPYTERMLATQFAMPVQLVRLALETFRNFRMVGEEDGFLCVLGWAKYQSADEMEHIRELNRQRQKKWRQQQKNNDNVTGNGGLTLSNGIEREIDIEKDKEVLTYVLPETENEKRLNYQRGKLFQGVVLMSDAQFDDICERLTYDEIHHYFGILTDGIINKGWKVNNAHDKILEMVTADRKV